LALAALNLVNISPRIIEPAIAASIIFVAAENFRRTEKSWPPLRADLRLRVDPRLRLRQRLARQRVGRHRPPRSPARLVAFNVGVEIGQLTVAAVLLPLLLLLSKWPWFTRNGTRLISALVIGIAAFWLCQRLMS